MEKMNSSDHNLTNTSRGSLFTNFYKKHALMVLIAVLILQLTIIGHLTYQNSQLKRRIISTQLIPQRTISPDNITATDKDNEPEEPESINLPQPHSIYLGTDSFKDKKVIFTANPKSQQVAVTYEDEGHGPLVDISKISNPQIIFTSADKIDSIVNFIIDETNSVIYISLSYPVTSNNLINKILKTNIESQESKVIWSNNVGMYESDLYENAGGMAGIEQIVGNTYLIARLLTCHFCGPSTAGKMVLNTKTGKHSYHKDIGNIQIDLDSNTFSYQSLSPFEVPCEDPPNPLCEDDKKMIIQKPSGKIFTEQLP